VNLLNPYPCPQCQARGCDSCKQTGREHFPHPDIDALFKAEGTTDRKAPLMDREAWETAQVVWPDEPAAVAAEVEVTGTKKRKGR